MNFSGLKEFGKRATLPVLVAAATACTPITNPENNHLRITEITSPNPVLVGSTYNLSVRAEDQGGSIPYIWVHRRGDVGQIHFAETKHFIVSYTASNTIGADTIDINASSLISGKMIDTTYVVQRREIL